MGIFNDQRDLKPEPKNQSLQSKITQSKIQQDGGI